MIDTRATSFNARSSKRGLTAFLLISFGVAWGWEAVAHLLLGWSLVNPLVQVAGRVRAGDRRAGGPALGHSRGFRGRRFPPPTTCADRRTVWRQQDDQPSRLRVIAASGGARRSRRWPRTSWFGCGLLPPRIRTRPPWC
jgi:hypothetical protein